MPQQEVTKPHLVPNTGSAARDYCMLERNVLSHLKLAVLLSLLSSSLLLNARLVPDKGNKEAYGSLPISVIEFVAAMACVVAGLWEYYNGYRDLMHARAFLVAVNSHLSIMTIVAGVVFGTCIVFILNDSGV